MLSATPYNKTYLDLSNQLRLFIQEDKDLGISPERFIESIGGRVQFMAKYQYSATTLPAFEKSNYVDDWRELMRLYMVRRPRSFIRQHYAETDPVNDRKYLLFSDGSRSYFPDRLPKKVEYDFNPNDPKDQYANNNPPVYGGKQGGNIPENASPLTPSLQPPLPPEYALPTEIRKYGAR